MSLQRTLAQFYGQPWHITTDHWVARHQEILARATGKSPEPRAAAPQRPDEDWLGNPIEKMRVVDGIAIVPLKGALVHKATPFDKWAWGDASYDDFRADMLAAADQSDTIVIDTYSPGGSVAGNEEAAAIVERLTETHSVWAYTDSLMASAAYKIAAASTGIVASPSSMVGSIGTICVVQTMAELAEKVGVSFDVFASGSLKDLGFPFADMKQDHIDHMRSEINRMGAEFRSYVQLHRVNVDQSSMEGQVFQGKEAINRGLVDQLSPSLDEFLASLR